MLEKEIEKFFRLKIKEMGGLCYKWISPGQSGVPDRIVILKKRIVFVELKTEVGSESALQKRQRKKIQSLGHDVKVLYGMEDVTNFLDEIRRWCYEDETA